uniref:Uncharacterized protein n=1 Tax=Cyprinus carpio TaxID=7962 RepID=A0A8C2KVD6_CYPCA
FVVNFFNNQGKKLQGAIRKRPNTDISLFSVFNVMVILLYFLSTQMWICRLPHCPALQFPSLPSYRSCHQGYIPQKYMQLKHSIYEMFAKCSFIETLFQLNANFSISEGFENNKNNANEPTEESETNYTEPVTVEHHHHQHEHHHHHQHEHHHHHQHVNRTGDSDVTGVPKEPIQHSHQEHSLYNF